MFFFFFFKQKTAYEMRISDWSSTCALPIYPESLSQSAAGDRGWHSRASCAGLYWRYATERGIGASLAKRMCSEASSDASPVRAFLCPARTRPVDQPEHIGESGALRFARPARRQTRRTGRRACRSKARSVASDAAPPVTYGNPVHHSFEAPLTRHFF